MTRVVDLDGRLLPLEEARVPTTDAGFLYGIGLFETFRAYGGTVFRLQEHLRRLTKSARQLEMPLDPVGSARDSDAGSAGTLLDHAKERVSAVLRANQMTDARVRLTVTGGTTGPDGPRPTVLITAAPLEAESSEDAVNGMTVRICSHLQSSSDLLAGHKTTGYWARLQVLHQAHLAGCGEALWFTDTRRLAEGCISNVFLVREGEVLTPSLDTPVLPGITRAAVLELCLEQGIASRETALGIDDLLKADEAFICNSIMEIVPVCRVERKPIADAKDMGADKLTTTEGKQAIIAATKTTNFEGVTGNVSFDEKGDTTNKVVTVYVVKDGAWVPFAE